MKVHNRQTGRVVEATLAFNTKDKDGQQWAVYHARRGYAVLWVPIDGDNVEIGQTFKDTEHLNSKGALCRITRKVTA